MIQCFKAHRPQAIPLNPVIPTTSAIQESLHGWSDYIPSKGW
jgi:hypothetical protein